MRDDRLITLPGFLDAFASQDRDRKDRPFCFIIGAGASQQSGIPGGAAMAKEWLELLHKQEDFDGIPLQQWATAERLGIAGFDFNDLARFYPELYSRCFREREEDGYAYLEKKMEGKDPSFGYSVLAYILSETPHKILITTNFDNLVADSLSIHSNTFPVIVGHDSLADYARVALRRPLIAKVHGSLGFAPKSDPKDLQCLTEQWQKALTRICERYTPIVIGYDGNDGSLMGSLESLPTGVPDTIFWCFRNQQDQPAVKLAQIPERVRTFVAAKKGRFVPIPGFDELMLLLHRRLSLDGKVPDLFDQLKRRSEDRVKRFDEQHQALKALLDQPRLKAEAAETPATLANPTTETLPWDELSRLLKEAFGDLTGQRATKPWWLWENEADSHADPASREQVYLAALKALPTSAPLLGNYANFLNRQGQFDEAETFYKRALEADPKLANHLSNYAVFLKQRGRHDEAETLHKRAVEADPKNANYLGNYAVFLSECGRLSEAESFYKQAVEADPKHANILGNYANFLSKRGRLDEAETFYQRALEADPKHANHLGNYAVFLTEHRRFDEAESFYKRAVEADPKHANHLSNYANFLNERGRLAEAETLYKRSLETDHTDVNNLGNYANFLREQGRLDQAEAFYKRAVEADSKHVNHLGNYALFLKQRGQADEAETFFKRAVEIDPGHATNLGNYANFLNERGQVDEAEKFYQRAIRADPKHANHLGNYANFLSDRGQFKEAEVLYKRAVEADAMHINHLGNYANFLQGRGRFDEAETFYQRALKVSPKHANHLGNYAVLLSERGRFDEAESFYRRSVEADPKHANHLGNYADFLKQRGRFNEAEEFFRLAVEADPKHSGHLGNYACFLSERGRFDEAEGFFQRALAADRTLATHLCNYAQHLFIHGRDQEAEARLNEVQDLSPTRQDVLVELAFYRAAHIRTLWPTILAHLKGLLASGARSLGWNLAPNVKAAAKAGHPNVPLLETLAAVISAGADLATLDAFPEWKAA